MFLRQILSCYNLKIFFSKLVKVLVLELFYGTRTRVHFSISVLVLVLEVFCGTRTRKLSTRLHHCPELSSSKQIMASFQWKDLNKSLIASKLAKYYYVFEEMTCLFISKFKLLYFVFHLYFTHFFLNIVLLPELLV